MSNGLRVQVLSGAPKPSFILSCGGTDVAAFVIFHKIADESRLAAGKTASFWAFSSTGRGAAS